MQNILNYLRMMIDDTVDIQLWDAKRHLNLQLAGLYQYYIVTLLGTEFLLMKPQENYVISKSKIHMTKIKEKTGYEAALLLETLTPYRMKKMLEEKIAFIVADKQMYLPFMALQIKQSREKEMVEREKFTATTQLVFLYVLYSDEQQFETGIIAKKLAISEMTVLRSMNELKRIGVITQTISGATGRKKIYFPIEKKEYYRVGKEYLINPVRKSIYVSKIPKEIKLYKSGLSALAEQTMLGEPEHIIYATNDRQSSFLKEQITREEALAEGMPEIQLMQYDIAKLTHNEYVDPLTLIMSLKNKDDRIEIAIEELTEGLAWYEE